MNQTLMNLRVLSYFICFNFKGSCFLSALSGFLVDTLVLFHNTKSQLSNYTTP